MSKVEPNCHLFTRVEPLVWYKLHIAALDSSNRVRGLDDLSNALVGEAVFSVRLPRQPHGLPRVRSTQYFHLL